MLHHYYIHSFELDYSGKRDNNEQETYMLLQDTATLTGTGNISIESEMVSSQFPSNEEDGA